MSVFTPEDINSLSYRWREKKKVKYFVYTVEKPSERDLPKTFNKRLSTLTVEDGEEDRDVDLCFLMEHYISKDSAFDQKDCEIIRNKTRCEILQHFESLQSNESLEKYDCFFFIFLTYMYGKDSTKHDESLHFKQGKVHLDEIYEKMDKIENLLNKPKIFLVQADDMNLLKDESLYEKAKGFKTEKKKIPHDADRVTILSTTPGRYFVADENPSFLLQAFVDEMRENIEREREERYDFLTLTAIINGRVERMITNWRTTNTDKQFDLLVPSVTSTLCKLLYFE